MTNHQHSVIAREGWWLLLLLLTIAITTQVRWGGEWPLIFWLLFIIGVVFFRDPKRKVPPLPLAVVAPVDGIITAVKECDDEYVKRKATCVQIKKPWYNIISIRSPMEGKVQKQWLKHRSEQENGEVTGAEFVQWIQSDEEDDVAMRLLPNFGANLIRWYAQSGERVGQGQRCGIFPFSLYVEVLVPENAQLEIKIGQRVNAGSDIIATLIH